MKRCMAFVLNNDARCVSTIAIATGIRRDAIYRVFTLFPTLFNPQNNLSSPKDILPRATLLPYILYEEGE